LFCTSIIGGKIMSFVVRDDSPKQLKFIGLVGLLPLGFIGVNVRSLVIEVYPLPTALSSHLHITDEWG